MKIYLSITTSAVALIIATSAQAQTSPASQTASVQDAAGATTDIPSNQENDIVVTAHTNQTNMAGGGMIAIQDAPVVRTTIGQGFIAKQIPAQNSLAAVRLAPGANVGQDNPYGISERGDLSVRGLDQTQMGFVLNGMPLGDPNNYLPNTNEWIDNENTKSVTLTQGTSDLTSPVLSASGGLIQVDMRDPSHEMGGTISGSYGKFNTERGFLRLESGDIGASGIRVAASYSKIASDNFRGSGRSTRDHADINILKEFNNGSRTGLIITYNYLRNFRSNIPTLAQFNTLGTSSNYAATYKFGATDYYEFYPFYRRVVFVQAPTKINITPDLTFETTPYFRYMAPNGPGGTNLPTSNLYYGNQQRAETLSVPYAVNGRFVALAMSNIGEYEAGINSSLTYRTGKHEIQAGIWYDHFNERALSKFTGVDQNGNTTSDKGGDFLTFANGDVLSSTNFRLQRETVAFYASDKISLLDDKLKLMFGIKQLMVSTTGRNYLPGSTENVGVHQSKPTPRFGATYSFGDSQVFFDIITNARPPSPGPTYMDVFNVSTGLRSTVGNQSTPMEYSFAQEVGYRYQSFINFSIAAFHNKLTNHQVNTIVNQNGLLTQSSISAGGETIYGLNAELGLRPWHNLSPYLSGQYLHSRTDDDLPVGGDFLPTKGKESVRTPKFMGSAGLTYDDGSLFSVITFRHVGSQFSTFMNDQKMPAYNQVDFGIGYRLPDIAFAKRPTVQVNLVNLFDGAYLGSIGSPTGAALATVGRKGTLIAASQPGYYENSKFTAMVTVKTDF
jgi:iron complex outermembrane receptor protein